MAQRTGPSLILQLFEIPKLCDFSASLLDLIMYFLKSAVKDQC